MLLYGVTRVRSAIWAAIAALLVTLVGTVVPPATPAAADALLDSPGINLAKEGPGSVLIGENADFTLTVTNPSVAAGGIPEYNVTLRDVLPPGVAYVSDSTTPAGAGNPTVFANQPATGQTTLVWTNVADVQPDGTYSLSYEVAANTMTYPVGATFDNSATAYANSDPRAVPDVSSTGQVTGDFTSTAGPRVATTTVSAIEVTKSEPSPENELLRGVHYQTVNYTINLRNNGANPTTGITVVDYLPAGLEFLQCGGIDNTPPTGSPTPEYPGAPSLTAVPSAGSGCLGPAASGPRLAEVETVSLPAGGAGPGSAAGVYTRVTWRGIDLAASGLQRNLAITYRAGIPMQANTTTFPGGAPTPDSLKQGANLSNNTGASTRETLTELSLTNYVSANGTYQGTGIGGQNPVPVSDSDRLTVRAEDLAMRKTVSPATFTQGSLAQYTLQVRTGEYATAAGIVITDTIHNGLCPVWNTQSPTVVGGPLPAGCGQGATRPDPANAVLDTVTFNPDGSFTVVFDPLARDARTTTPDITYSVLMRSQRSNPNEPTVAGDTFTNRVVLAGTTTPIPAVSGIESGPQQVADASQATISSVGPTIDKAIGVDRTDIDCTTADYETDPATPPLFREGDRVCFLLDVTFPTGIGTRNPVVTDFLPPGVRYESVTATGANTVAFLPDATGAPATGGGSVRFTIGTNAAPVSPPLFVAANARFQVWLSGIVVTDSPTSAPDLTANLMKFRSEDSAGQALTLRDQTDLKLAAVPPLTVRKRVVEVDEPPFAGPPADGVAVREGSTARFVIEVTNAGLPQNQADYPVQALDVWDVLPPGIRCANTSDRTGPSDPGATITCYNPGDAGQPAYAGSATLSLIRWTYPSTPVLAAGQSTTVSYRMTIPTPTSAGLTLTDTAHIRSYETGTNLGGFVTHFPQENVDTSVPPADQDAPIARDPSWVFTPGATVAKSATTSVDEANNNLVGQATVGELVDYTYSVTIPAKTSVFGGALTDALPAGFTILPPATATFCADAATPPPCGATLPNGVTLDSNTGTLSFADAYDNTTTTAQRFEVTVRTQVTGTALSTGSNNQNRVNTATFRSTATPGGSQLTPVTAEYTINLRQPSPSLTKSNNAVAPVAGGDTVVFTLTPRTAGGTARPPLHDVTLTDCLPPQLILVSGSLTDGGSATPGTAGDCGVGWTRITWSIGTLQPNGSAPRTFSATVAPSAVAGDVYTNRASMTGSSMAGEVSGERTYTRNATSSVTVQGATVAKSVDDGTLPIGETTTWTLRVTTPADVNLYGLAMIDQVPAGITAITKVSASCRVLADDADCTSAFPGLGTALTPSPVSPLNGSLPVAYGWLIGEVAGDGKQREFTLTYTGRVADIPANVAGVTRTNTLLAKWFAAPGTTPTSAGQAFDRTSSPATATVRVLEPDPGISKSVVSGTPEPSEQFTYTVRVANGGGANVSAAYNLEVTDAVPVGVVVDESSITEGGTLSGDDPTTGGGTITWLAANLPGPLDPGTSLDLTYSATLAPSSGLTAAPLLNTATLTGFESLPSGGRSYTGGDAEATVTPRFPRLANTKTATSGAPAYIGQQFTWTVTTTNSGDATAYAVDIIDSLPPNWTYVAGSAQVVVTGESARQVDPTVITAGAVQDLRWDDLTDLPPGHAAQITFRATPQSAVAANPGVGSTVAHVNSVNSFGQDSSGASGNAVGSYGDDPAEAQTRIDSADVQIVKTHTGTALAGGTFDWNLVVANNGLDTAVGPFTVTDVIAAPTTFVTASGVGWSCSGSGSPVSVTCQRSDASQTLASGVAFAPIRITVGVPSDTESGTVVQNTATVTARTYDPVPGNNTDTDSVVTTASADLKIVKDSSGTVAAGRPMTYTLSVSNLGPSTSRKPITVTDPLPAGTSFVSAAGSGWTCGQQPAGTVRCTSDANLLAGEVASQITVVAAVGSAVTGDLVNTATVTGTTPDPNPDNNTSTVTDPVDVQADLAIEKTHTGPFTPGTPVPPATLTNTWDFTVVNNGPADAAAPVTITDELPAYLTFTGDWTNGAGTWQCSAAPATAPTPPARQTVTCVLADGLVDGATAEVSIGVAVSTSLDTPGEFTNTATVTSPTPDPVPDNNTSTTRTDYDLEADLVMTKSPATQTVIAGSASTPATWSLLVTNQGPSASIGPTVVYDLLPAGATLRSATGPDGSGWSCAAAGRLVVCRNDSGVAAPTPGEPPTPGSLPVITIVADLSPDSGPATEVNVAGVDGPTPDPNPGNNVDEAEVTVTDLADLAITKVHTGSEPATAGGRTTFRLRVNNVGPSDADAVQVSDTLPAGLTPVSVDGDGWSCGFTGVVVACTRPILAAGATAPDITLTVRIDSGVPNGATISNTAVVDSATPDPVPANNSGTDSVPVVASADLTLVKSHTGEPVAGGQVTYDITVANDGLSDALAPIMVTDELPVGLSYVSGGSGWTCSASGTPAVNQVVSCVLIGDSPLIAGTTAPTLTITVAIAPTVPAGGLVNTATAVSPTPDPNPDNNTDTDTITVTRSADVSVVKTHSGAAAIGATLVFTLQVANAGPSTATDVTVQDTLPPGLTLVSASGSGWRTCTTNGQTLTCSLDGDLAPGASASPVNVVVDVGPQAAPGVVNTATVTTTTPDPEPTNDTSTDTVGVPPRADVSIVKSHQGAAIVGERIAFSLRVRNAGPSAAESVTVSDTLPSGLGYVRATGDGWTCRESDRIVTCALSGALAAEATASVIELVVDVREGAYPQAVNTATVSTTTPESTTENNTATDRVEVQQRADVLIAKSHSGTAAVGGVAEFTLAVSNNGPSAAEVVRVSDSLPAGLTYVSANGDGWSCSGSGGSVSCDLAAALAAGASAAPIRLRVSVGRQAVPQVVNTAMVSTTTPETTTDNNTATDTLVVTRGTQEPVKPIKPDRNPGELVIVPGETTGNQTITARARCFPARASLSPTGDVRYCTVTRKKSGKLVIRTSGPYPMRVRVVFTAPGTDAYRPYREVKVFTIRKPRR